MDALSSATRVEEYLVQSATEKRIPLGGSLELLPLCNMNCDMCYVRLSREEMERKGRIRSVDEWVALAEEMRSQGVLFLLLTGGEPLLYVGFKELYLKLLQMGMIVTINTNGTLIDENWAEFFGTHKPRRINITLYGKDEDTYESLCHYRAGFYKTLRGIELLKKQNVDVKLNGSLTIENCDTVERLMDIADELGVPIQIDTYMYPASRERDKGFQEETRLDPEEAAKAKIRIAKHRLGEEFSSYCEQIWTRGHLPEPETAECSIRCRAGKSSFVITWQGKMMPCTMMQGIAYDVFDMGFAASWSNMVEAVECIKVSENCALCAQREICQSCAACAMLETGDYDGTPEYLCRFTKTLLEGIEHGRK